MSAHGQNRHILRLSVKRKRISKSAQKAVDTALFAVTVSNVDRGVCPKYKIRAIAAQNIARPIEASQGTRPSAA